MIRKYFLPVIFCICLAACVSASPDQNKYAENMQAGQAEKGKVIAACLLLAAKEHSIPPAVLLGILKVKDGKVGEKYGPLPDGSFDLGLMKVNTSEIADLSRSLNVDEKTAKQLLIDDPCIGAGVVASRIRKLVDNGNSLLQSIALSNGGTEPENERFVAKVEMALAHDDFIQRN